MVFSDTLFCIKNIKNRSQGHLVVLFFSVTFRYYVHQQHCLYKCFLLLYLSYFGLLCSSWMVIYRFKDGLSTLEESFQENLCDFTDKSLFKNELLSYFHTSIEEDLE